VVVSAFVQLGGTLVKLTGGDPALYADLVRCVATLKGEVGVQQLQVISRHPRIGTLARQLADAGVDLIALLQ
jgi:cyclic pyranopterin phosphate synthase